ncbi:heme ABC exporter ATP-binding protein CcmA [Novosphingobium sp. Gsoil 351]|uniref:heme ABC exporter ATP-binding protein CcmA n=1 Tax=Novosphingobium sp. Gsoil 351 TaxID=2675225 RepID=UPI0012B49F20|nr:heme ABC exporter ATP-binding protein CcmA [Novosphingobium sp. Gsoil 351]QGN54363.1 heme ABC exporter ATP-binding protein CcmA [Novosphingobium sp. Gsoil 351]
MPACRLAAHDLACRRGDRVLFRGLGFALNPGEALHLAGPNGIGKSSLIRILVGLLRPYAGSVERVGSLALADERLALDGHLPLGRALEFWRAFDRTSEATLDTAIETLGLGNLLDVPVRYLSTGQRKRAALARTLLAGAPIWLLDEPLNGLDTATAATVQGLVARHVDGGGIAVIASHQPFALAGMARLELAAFEPIDA